MTCTKWENVANLVIVTLGEYQLLLCGTRYDQTQHMRDNLI